jgi:thiol-disulfide isomerase/thioredoxin
MWKWTKRVLLSIVGLFLALVLFVLAVTLWERPSKATRQYIAVRRQWDELERQRNSLSKDDFAATEAKLSESLNAIANEHPNSQAELAALILLDNRAPDNELRKQAAQRLKDRLANVDLDDMAAVYNGFGYGNTLRHDGAAIQLFAHVKTNLDHPKVPYLLTRIASSILIDEEATEPPAAFTEIANIVVERFPRSLEIDAFCSRLGSGNVSPRWAHQFESHLQTILNVNEHRWVRCCCQLALADIARADPNRQSEAQDRYQALLDEFEKPVNDMWSAVVEHHCHNAKMQLEAMQFAPIGKPAPEIVGIDLAGQSMTLSQHRGNVVLLTYWATWCGPCMKLVPHEKSIVDKYAGKPFVIVGVNADKDPTVAQQAEKDKGITWRSFQDYKPDSTIMSGAKTISDRWQALFPTVYLIDHHGIIRHRYCGTPHPDEIDEQVAKLLAAMDTK